jgi:uncharacterized protein (DUF433 family)
LANRESHEDKPAAHWRKMMSATAIIDGRITGTRSTVYDVYHYLQSGRRPEEIMEILRLRQDQLAVATRFIEEHAAEVHAAHIEIEERTARGNPPEVEAKLAQTRTRMEAWLKQRKAQISQEANGEGHRGG